MQAHERRESLYDDFCARRSRSRTPTMIRCSRDPLSPRIRGFPTRFFICTSCCGGRKFYFSNMTHSISLRRSPQPIQLHEKLQDRGGEHRCRWAPRPGLLSPAFVHRSHRQCVGEHRRKGRNCVSRSNHAPQWERFLQERLIERNNPSALASLAFPISPAGDTSPADPHDPSVDYFLPAQR